MNDQNAKQERLFCPFCNEPDFDLVGLKNHLHKGDCATYTHTELTFSPFDALRITPASTPADAPTGIKALESVLLDDTDTSPAELRADLEAQGVNVEAFLGRISAAVAPTDATGEAGEIYIKAGSPEHVAIWDAINEFTKYPGVCGARMDAVVQVERAITQAIQITAARTIATLRAECEGLRDRLAYIDDLTCDVKPDEDSEAGGTIEERVEALVQYAASRGTEGQG